MPNYYIPEFSYSNYTTYEIKERDTPENVAHNMGISVDQLRTYHNRFCPLEDLIGPSFPIHLKFVIIQPPTVNLTDEQKEQQRQKVVFNDAPGKLTLNHSHGENTYAVQYTIENGKEIYTIKQQIKISWRAKNEGYHFYYVSRYEDLYVNNIAANTMIEEIAQKASQALYPMLIVVDENGKWVYINNYDQIVERWNETKSKIRKYYKGDQTEKYFKIYDKNLEDEDSLFFSIQKDWFLNALFNEIHVQYPQDLSLKKHISFPHLAKTENIQYLVHQEIDDHLNIDNLIVIDINGKLDDSRTKTDFQNELKIPVKEYSEEKALGNYKAKYFLNPNTYMPEAFTVSCDLALDIPQKYTVTATNLHTAEKLVIASRELTFAGVYKPEKRNYSLLYIILLFILGISIIIFTKIFLSRQ
ncbi:MAG: hypothetical protein REI96_01130 [Flavobacterium nitrogenifigens]|uniref:hypothetical protein n=1 Tax=Flavobacterium nitrogenifigens TaxID=1617283 RepID=UPI002807A7AF|nr:hypothetical protein [Flavobacterium nitrogenifigens]MDQ8011021.1 hypothetical protein [Flavobacterium nitrogenifigens]